MSAQIKSQLEVLLPDLVTAIDLHIEEEVKRRVDEEFKKHRRQEAELQFPPALQDRKEDQIIPPPQPTTFSRTSTFQQDLEAKETIKPTQNLQNINKLSYAQDLLHRINSQKTSQAT